MGLFSLSVIDWCDIAIDLNAHQRLETMLHFDNWFLANHCNGGSRGSYLYINVLCCIGDVINTTHTVVWESHNSVCLTDCFTNHFKSLPSDAILQMLCCQIGITFSCNHWEDIDLSISLSICEYTYVTVRYNLKRLSYHCLHTLCLLVKVCIF